MTKILRLLPSREDFLCAHRHKRRLRTHHGYNMLPRRDMGTLPHGLSGRSSTRRVTIAFNDQPTHLALALWRRRRRPDPALRRRCRTSAIAQERASSPCRPHDRIRVLAGVELASAPATTRFHASRRLHAAQRQPVSDPLSRPWRNNLAVSTPETRTWIVELSAKAGFCFEEKQQITIVAALDSTAPMHGVRLRNGVCWVSSDHSDDAPTFISSAAS